MKKLATLAILAMIAGSASAASITWGFGGQVYVSKDGTAAVLGTDFTGTVPWSLALVYVGQSQTSFSIDVLSADSVVDSMAYGVSASGKTAGKWNPAQQRVATTAYEDGASFAVVLFDSTKQTFDYVYSLTGTTTVGSAVTTATPVTDMSARGSAIVYGAGTGTANGVVVVPEPSVALMGLLGIGMLICRRRA